MMTVVSTPKLPQKDRFRSPILNDDDDAERQLCSTVDAMLASVTRTVQQLSNEKSVKVHPEGTTASFMRANGIHVAQENIDESGTARVGGRSGNGEVEAALRIQLENCRDLLRKVDSERRYVRKQFLHLQGEQEQRRAGMEAFHRYSAASHQRSLTLEHHVAEERRRRRQLEEQLDTQTQELMQLRRVLRALPGDLVLPPNSPQSYFSSPATMAVSPFTAHPLVPDRRFEEAFKDKMNSIVYKRRYRQASTLHQAASEQLEALLMEQQDPQHVQVRVAYAGEREPTSSVDSTGSANEFSGADPANQVNGTGTSNATALSGARFWQTALDFPFQLPFSTATPQDPVIKSLIYHSRFAEPLMQLWEHARRLTSRLKTTQDAGLRSLYMALTQALQRLGTTQAQTQCRSLYERQMEKMQRAHRELLYSLIEQVNRAVTEITEAERASSGLSSSMAAHGGRGGVGGGTPGVQRRDVGCSAQESVSIEKYRVSHLKEQLTKLKLQSVEAAAAALKEREATSVQCTAARQEALQALQSLKKLTTCVVASVQAQKAADEVVYDPLEQVKEPITEDVLDDPRLVSKMSEATDLTLTYVHQLARNSNKVTTTAVTVGSKAQVSSARAPHNLADSTRFSSSLTFGGDSAREGAYSHIIDIHHRDGAFDDTEEKAGGTRAIQQNDHHNIHNHNRRFSSARKDRRKSAPSSLSTTMRRVRSKSVAAANRRQTVPQLPAMSKTPTAPATKRGTRGRPESSGTSAIHTPPLEDKKDGFISSLTNPSLDLRKASKEKLAMLPGRNPNVALSIIELGFSENNIRLN